MWVAEQILQLWVKIYAEIQEQVEAERCRRIALVE